MNWYLMRHGEIASNRAQVYSGRSDEALTAFGREQVNNARDEFSALRIDAIFSSPLTRTRQTAAILVENRDDSIPLHIDEHFNEILMGPWQGKSALEVAQDYPQAWALWQNQPAALQLNGRETLQQLQQRAVAGLADIARNYAFDSVLIVTHVAVIRVLSLYAAGHDLNRYKSMAVANAEIFSLHLPELS